MVVETMHTQRPGIVGLEKMTREWGYIAGLLMASGYIVYLGMFFFGGVVPNATSWTLWALGGAVEAWSYRKVIRSQKKNRPNTDGIDPLEIPSWVCAGFAIIIAALGIGSALLAVYGLVPPVKAFELPSQDEWLIAGADILVIITYLVMKKRGHGSAAQVANALMVLDIFLSFIPIWHSTWINPGQEHVIPWFVWTGSYMLLAAMGTFQINRAWKDRLWLLLYPLTSALFHGLVAIIILIRGGV